MLMTNWLRVAVLLALMPAAGSAQSLVDVAKQEAERRNTVKPGKRLTNADLKADFTTPAPPPSAIASSAAGSAPAVPGNASPGEPAAVTAPATDPAPDPPKEEVWRAQAAGHRATIAKANAAVASLTGAAHADPRIQAQAEAMLKTAQKGLADAQEALRQFEAEAAAKKIPADWIR
jgi:antitoxin (DNA-binding transcriptional repressor) of toxin-antitoxin stability system